MTHEELLAKIDHMWNDDFDYVASCHTNALRAVVELHKPKKVKHNYYKSGLGCSSPDCIDHYLEPIEWPCKTIKVIKKALK